VVYMDDPDCDLKKFFDFAGFKKFPLSDTIP
jgi:hypothetical protein